MPVSPATIRSLARPMNRPCSMIPARAERVAASATGSTIGGKWQSRIMFPESVTNCAPSSSCRITGSVPSDARNLICERQPNAATSTGNEKCSPRADESLESSTMMISRRVACATIFSRRPRWNRQWESKLRSARMNLIRSVRQPHRKCRRHFSGDGGCQCLRRRSGHW